MIDILSYILGLLRGIGKIIFDASNCTVTDKDNDGNIVMEVDDGE